MILILSSIKGEITQSKHDLFNQFHLQAYRSMDRKDAYSPY